MSAVSKKLTPQSRAASTTIRVWAWSIRMPKLLQPSPITLTLSPLFPSLRSCMASSRTALTLET